MKIYKLDTESDFEKLDLCLAIGNFDGIHKGHQEIINKIKEIASNNNLLSSIMSFNPHPRIFFNQINEPFNIYTCLLYTSQSPRDLSTSRMPSSA